MDKPVVRTEPHDLVALRATVGLRFGLTLTAGQAYDQHLNMILGDVEETVTSVEYDEDTFEELVKVHLNFIH